MTTQAPFQSMSAEKMTWAEAAQLVFASEKSDGAGRKIAMMLGRFFWRFRWFTELSTFLDDFIGDWFPPSALFTVGDNAIFITGLVIIGRVAVYRIGYNHRLKRRLRAEGAY